MKKQFFIKFIFILLSICLFQNFSYASQSIDSEIRQLKQEKIRLKSYAERVYLNAKYSNNPEVEANKLEQISRRIASINSLISSKQNAKARIIAAKKKNSKHSSYKATKSSTSKRYSNSSSASGTSTSKPFTPDFQHDDRSFFKKIWDVLVKLFWFLLKLLFGVLIIACLIGLVIDYFNSPSTSETTTEQPIMQTIRRPNPEPVSTSSRSHVNTTSTSSNTSRSTSSNSLNTRSDTQHYSSQSTDGMVPQDLVWKE